MKRSSPAAGLSGLGKTLAGFGCGKIFSNFVDVELFFGNLVDFESSPFLGSESIGFGFSFAELGCEKIGF